MEENMVMTEKQKQILALLQRAIYRFNKNETYLMRNNLCERCICSKFAMYIESSIRRSQFKEYTTDVEYDRGMGGNDSGKKIVLSHDAYLDLIVHKRGHFEHVGYDNLFAIEMKKSAENFDGDKARLRILVDSHYGFNYRASFAIRIVLEPNTNTYELRIEESFFHDLDF